MSAIQMIRRTTLWRKHGTLGATFVEVSDWQIADRFTTPESEVRAARENVGLADVSWLSKFDVKGSDFKADKESVTPGSLWALAPGHALVTCRPEDSEHVNKSLEDLVAQSTPDGQGACCHVTNVTSVYAALMLLGPNSRDVLNRLTELEISDAALPEGSCSQTGLAHTHAIILRQDTGDVPGFLLFVGWEYGEYVWDALVKAGEYLGIAPVGLEAVNRLGLIRTPVDLP